MATGTIDDDLITITLLPLRTGPPNNKSLNVHQWIDLRFSVTATVSERGWCIGRVDAFRPKGHGFHSRSSHHVGTLLKSFTHRCLWRFSLKFRYSIRAVSGEPLSSSGLGEAL